MAPGSGAGGAEEYPAAAVQPAQPNGKVWRREELETMAALCQKHGVRVISDEIHMDMTWGEHRHIPWSEVAQGPWALFTSGSKSFNIPAFTGAYGFIPEANERDSYLQALKAATGSLPLRAGAGRPYRRLPRRGPWLDALRDYLQANMRYVADTLNNAFPRSAGSRRRPPTWPGSTCARSTLTTARCSRR
jgi:cystathionine beta-lyase